MKHLYTLLLFFPFSAFSQSYVTMSAGNADNQPSSACLACAGAEWNNFMNISATDGMTVDVNLTQNGMCFQSTCYVSRYLYASNFGFSIPLSATIDSIFVDVTHSGATAGTIRDSVMQLYKSTTITGNSHPDAAAWPATFATVSYGHNDPLWGTTWTPADLNDTNSGVVLKVQNLSAAQALAHVDHVQMTVWYSTANGVASATSSPAAATWINSPNEIAVNFPSTTNENYSSELYNLQGQLVISASGNFIPGMNHLLLPVADLPAGVYTWRIRTNEQIFTRKIFISNH